MITDEMPRFHPRYKHRILYAGNNLALSWFLRDELKDCQVVRAPVGFIARLFIEKLKYSLLLFDRKLPDTTARELARFTRGLAHRQQTPIIIIKKASDFERLAKAISKIVAAEIVRRIDFNSLHYRTFKLKAEGCASMS